MINKFLKLSKISLLGLGLIFGVVNINAEQTLLTDEQKEQVGADVQNFAHHMESLIERDFNAKWQDLRGANVKHPGLIHYSLLSDSATSIKYNAEMAINTNGVSPLVLNVARSNVTGVYYKFANHASVPAQLRDKTIALILEHGAFDVATTPASVTVDNFKCYTNINSTGNIASYVGESVSNQGSTVNLLQFTELGFDRASAITTCAKAQFYGSPTDQGGDRILYTAPTSNHWFKLKPM